MSSIWDALSGRRKPSHQQQSSSSSSSSSSSTPPQSTQGFPSTSSLTAAPFDPADGSGVDSFLRTSAFADASQLHPLAGINKDALEYLTLDDSALSDLPGGQSVIPSRGFTDDLCYGTGVTYLSALALGGAWGLQEGLRRSVNQPPKLRLNSVLNAVTRRGPFLGNSAGVIAVAYNFINSYIGYLRGKHDAANSIAAGTLSGMLFRSTRGVKPMMISGAIVGSLAAAWAIGRKTLFPAPIEKEKEAHLVL